MKNSACGKTVTPSYNPNSWNKTAVEIHKRRTNDKNFLFISFVNNSWERSLQSSTDSAYYPLHCNDTTRRNVFISLFPFFLLARIQHFHLRTICTCFLFAEKLKSLKKMVASRTNVEIQSSTDEKCHWSRLRKGRLYEEMSKYAKTTSILSFFSFYCLRKIVQGSK